MLFEMARALRSLTRSPIESALHSARHMARPFRFEEGGAVKSQAAADNQHNDDDFVLPSDVREEEVLTEVQDRLRATRFSIPERSKGAISSLKTTADGRLFVPADVVLLLGDGAADRGKRVLEKIVNKIRQRRVLDRLPTPNRRF
jgi:hypothetical protein